MSTNRFQFSRALARALTTVVVITFVVLVIGLSSAAFGANPAEEMAKVGTTDPKGDSWQAIQHSLNQFAHPEFMLRLFLSLSLAVACAWAIAWHPRRSSLAMPSKCWPQPLAPVSWDHSAMLRAIKLFEVLFASRW